MPWRWPPPPGVAIENARLYDDSRRRARWLEACMDVSGLMLSSDRDYTSGGLDPIASRALQESGSQLALLVAAAGDASGHIVAGVAGKRGSQFSGRPLTTGLAAAGKRPRRRGARCS